MPVSQDFGFAPYLTTRITLGSLYQQHTKMTVAGFGDSETVLVAILFSQLGFADEALTLIIPLSMVLEFPTVAIDAFCAKCQVLLLASTAGKIDLTQARAD